MKCVLFHSWSNWSELKEGKDVFVTVSSGQENRLTFTYQDRKCDKCGRVQVKRIK